MLYYPNVERASDQHNCGQGIVEDACRLIGRLGHNNLIKNSIRELGGLAQLLRQLQEDTCPPQGRQVIIQALTSLVIENEINQDYVR